MRWSLSGGGIEASVPCGLTSQSSLWDVRLVVWTVVAILYVACGRYPGWMHRRLVEMGESVES